MIIKRSITFYILIAYEHFYMFGCMFPIETPTWWYDKE